MTELDEQGRREPPLQADEVTMLRGFLDFQRDTLRWKTDGLDAAGLAARTAASTMTLGGLLKHLAFVEDYWTGHRLRGRSPSEPWVSVDWDADHDWDWRSAADDTPDELRELWREAVARSDADVDAVLADGGLDATCVPSRGDTRAPSLRWVLVHLVEEYARHNGHADLLREAVDGATGE